MPNCKKGEILRKGYTTETGVHVAPACIKATSESGKKSAIVNAPKVRALLAEERRAEALTAASSPKSCPEGMIRRSAFMRTSASGKETAIPAECIKEQGKKNGQVGLINPKTGLRTYVVLDDEKDDPLHKFGYHVKGRGAAERQAILDKVYIAKDKKWLPLFRKLNYLAVLNKSHEEIYRKLLADRDYIKAKYAPASSK